MTRRARRAWRRLRIRLALGVVTTGLALLAAASVDPYLGPTHRLAAYALALLAVYAACVHTVARSGRRRT